MELKYLWIEEYRSLKNFEINFAHSGEHQFEYDGKQLITKPNPKQLLKFGQNILSLNAIAGQNGSGKTSIMEVLLELLATLNDNSMGHNALELKAIIVIRNEIFYHEDLNIENYTNLIPEYILVDYKESPFENQIREEELDEFSNFIFHSSEINYRSFDYHNNSLINISNDYFINNHENYTHRKIREIEKKVGLYRDLDRIGTYEALYREDSRKWLNLFLHSNHSGVEFKPENIFLSLNFSGNNKYLDNYELQSLQSEILSFEKHTFYTNRITKGVNGSQLILAFERLGLLNMLIAFDKKEGLKIKENEYRNFVFKRTIPKYLSKNKLIIEWCQLFSQIIKRQKKKRFSDHYKAVSNGYRDGIRDSANINFYILASAKLSFDSIIDKSLLTQFLNIERKLFYRSTYVTPYFSDYLIYPSPSAGELSALNFYARLFDTLRDSEQNHFIILLDEPDTSYHPQWKKQFLNNFFKFLEQNFPKKLFQIIFTTHSPYLISDLPRENVKLIMKGESGPEIVSNKKIKTFGANIHELLAESFFLENGTIGDFAFKTLESLIEYLKSEEEKTEDWEEEKAESIIDEVGDMLIKCKLEDLFNEKFNHLPDIEEEEALLEARLKELRALKKRK